MSIFKEFYSLEQRKAESSRILLKYPDRVPVVCEKLKSRGNYNTPTIDKNKYLVPMDLTIGQFMFVVRKRIAIKAEEAIYLFVAGSIPSSSSTMISLYEQFKDEDGYLYILYSMENTFGSTFEKVEPNYLE
jgi:GABA(A) receptor-associated protein